MKKRRSYEQGLSLVRNFQSSGLSQVEFCRREKKKVAALQYWLRRSKEKKREVKEPVRFIEVRSGSQTNQGKIRLELPSGIMLSFEEVPDVDFMTRLVTKLQSI